MSIQTGQPVLTLTVDPTKPHISLIWYEYRTTNIIAYTQESALKHFSR